MSTTTRIGLRLLIFGVLAFLLIQIASALAIPVLQAWDRKNTVDSSTNTAVATVTVTDMYDLDGELNIRHNDHSADLPGSCFSVAVDTTEDLYTTLYQTIKVGDTLTVTYLPDFQDSYNSTPALGLAAGDTVILPPEEGRERYLANQSDTLRRFGIPAATFGVATLLFTALAVCEAVRYRKCFQAPPAEGSHPM
jgi:hypothetical protein